jgi:hypothetical protein
MKWEEPGPQLRQLGKWEKRVRVLKLHPGRWASWPCANHGSASSRANYLSQQYPQLETTSRGDRVYARYMPA